MFADFNLTKWWESIKQDDPYLALLILFGLISVCIAMIGIGTAKRK